MQKEVYSSRHLQKMDILRAKMQEENYVLKLNQQLELVNSQVENLLRAVEDDGSSTISVCTTSPPLPRHFILLKASIISICLL